MLNFRQLQFKREMKLHMFMNLVRMAGECNVGAFRNTSLNGEPHLVGYLKAATASLVATVTALISALRRSRLCVYIGSVRSCICSSGCSHLPVAAECGAITMATLACFILPTPRSLVFRPIAGHEASSCTEVNFLISLNRASGRAWCGTRAASGLGGCRAEDCCDLLRAEHVKALNGLEQEHGTATCCFSPRSAGRKRRAQNWRCKAHLDSVQVGFAEEANGAAIHRNEKEERLLPRQQSGDLSEIRLKSVRGPDFAGASISSHLWEWRHRWNIHYECAGMENTNAPALLLLPGFGVGSFHYDQQLRDLGREFRVWAIDFLGQGKSWPSHDPAPAEEVIEQALEGQANAKTRDWGFGKTSESWAQELVYSVDTWRDQVHAFIEKVIGEPVYIVGNSLGGYVGTYFAATNPELVKGMALLNATPFWAFMPNARRYPLLSKLVPWGGLLPVPAVAKVVIRIWWDLLRNPVTVKKMIQLVYADCSVVDEKLIRQMVEATDHPAAFAAFASIVFAPRAHTDFGQNIISLKEARTPMCMIYGKEDPWVVPFWGARAKQRNPDAVYYELSPAGHCPHHEAPEVVNSLVRKWVESVQSQGGLLPPLLETGVDQKQVHWFVVENEGKRVSVRVKGTQGFWSNLMDSFREVFAKHSLQSQVVGAVEET